ncbi:MAG: ATP-binding protein [Colwellia sp.]
MFKLFHIEDKHRLPRSIVIAVIIICVLPFLLQLFGVDFGNALQVAVTSQTSVPVFVTTDEIFYQLSGSFTHALLEWTAFSAAIFVVLLAFCHYSITNNITTPVIGVALFCAGVMDAFHTLAATRLISSVAENNDFIPSTWALSRTFNAIIMISGVGMFLSGRKIKAKNGMKIIIITSLIFASLGYIFIYFSVTSYNLPQIQFPDSIIHRPYDILPLILFLFAGLIIYPLFAKRYPSIFASALLLSALPEVVVELHVVFGSQRLFDSDFNIAHFLKIIAYVIPLAGLVLDYQKTYKARIAQHEQLKATYEELNIKAFELDLANSLLTQSNAELEKFAYIASHDLQEPLRKIQAFGDRLHKRIVIRGDEKSIDYINRMQNSSIRMRCLIDDLLKLSQLGNKDYCLQKTDLNAVLVNVLDDLHISILEKSAQIKVDKLPHVLAEPNKLYQVFLNLLSNSLKFAKEDELPVINITSQQVVVENRAYWQINIQDNGIGFEQEYATKIFEVFQRLHGRSQYQGTGMGLAICKKIMEKHHGMITVEAELNKGTCFILLFKV